MQHELLRPLFYQIQHQLKSIKGLPYAEQLVVALYLDLLIMNSSEHPYHPYIQILVPNICKKSLKIITYAEMLTYYN